MWLEFVICALCVQKRVLALTLWSRWNLWKWELKLRAQGSISVRVRKVALTCWLPFLVSGLLLFRNKFTHNIPYEGLMLLTLMLFVSLSIKMSEINCWKWGKPTYNSICICVVSCVLGPELVIGYMIMHASSILMPSEGTHISHIVFIKDTWFLVDCLHWCNHSGTQKRWTSHDPCTKSKCVYY